MRYVRLLVLVVSLVIAGCSKEQSRNLLFLEKAEKAVATTPYTAICLLDQCPKDSLTKDSEKALYALIRCEAMHRMGIENDNDSLISKSRQYYRKHHDPERYARALLHHGIYLYSAGQHRRAIEMIKSAEQRIGETDNIYFEYSVYETLGTINANVNNHKLAQHYYHKALDAAAKTYPNNSLRLIVLNKLIETFEAGGQQDSIAPYLKQCHKLTEDAPRDMRATTLTNAAAYHLKLGDTIRAQKMLQQAQTTFQQYKTLKLQADIHAARGNMEQACSLWYEVLTAPDHNISIPAHHKLIQHFKKTGQWKRAIFVSSRLNEIYEKQYISTNAQETTYLQERYDREKTASLLHRTRNIMTMVTTVLVAAIVLFVYYYRRRIKHINNRYTADLRLYNETKAELSGLQRRKEIDAGLITEKMTEIEQLQKRLAEYQDDRRGPDDWNVQSQLLQAPIVMRLHSLAARGKTADDIDWSELNSLAATHMPALTTLLNSVSTLTMKEHNVCLLIRLRFIPSEIAAITNTSPQTITNMRVRMLTKIFGERGGARDFDNKIRTV